MTICAFHNKTMCHLPELKERKRRQKKKENDNSYVPLHFKKYDEYKIQEDLGRGSKQNCSSLAALCHRAKGKALTEEGSVDLCQARRSLGCPWEVAGVHCNQGRQKNNMKNGQLWSDPKGLEPSFLVMSLIAGSSKIQVFELAFQTNFSLSCDY